MSFELPDRHFWMKALSLLTVMICLGLAFQNRFRIGIDPQVTLSMKNRVFLIDLKNREPIKGQSFVFGVENATPVYADGTELVKTVVGIPGDKVEITKNFEILVNDQFIARGLWHLRDMKRDFVIDSFTGSTILGPDQFWLMGIHDQSFDSRYFGPVSAKQIRGRAYGIF